MTEWTEADIQAQIPALQRYARVITRDIHEAEELVQQVLLMAYEKASIFRPGASLKPWLLAILRNQFLTNKRRESARQAREANYSDLTATAFEQLDPEQAAFVSDVARRFDELSEEHRSVLHLIAIEGMTYRETAETLDVPIGTVMSRLARSRAALKEALTRKSEPHLRLIGDKDDL